MSKNPTLARHAIMAAFFLHGILLGGWITHIPLAYERLGVSNAMFGVALLSFAAGAVVAMPLTGGLISRFGSAPITLFWGLAFAVLIFGPAYAPTLPLFMLGGALLGASVGSMDVAMNAHGLAVELALKRPVMSGFHGGFSAGAAVGTLAGAWLLRAVGPDMQIAIIALTGAIGLVIVARYFLHASVDKGFSPEPFAMPTRTTVGLGLLAFLALMIEGSVADWGAIMLQQRFSLDAATAAQSFGFYQAGMAAARFVGDPLRLRFGAVRLVFWSAVLTAVGTAAAIVLPSFTLCMIAFTIGGIGIGNVAPIMFAGGGRLEPSAPGRGIAAVTSLGYMGFMAGPPLIGFVAELTNLQWGIAVTVAGALIIAAFARMVRSADTY